MKKITVIGGGNMGGAIARGAVVAGVIAPENLTVSDPSEAVHDVFRALNPAIKLSSDNASAAQCADIVVVAVKPWLMESVLGEIRDRLKPEQIIVSIVAGKTFAQIEQMLSLPHPTAIFRIIPNTAITLSKSVTVISHNNATEEQVADIEAIFAPLGSTFIVPEQQMTPMTALGSCGTAYAFRYIDAAIRGGEELGLERETAREVVIQTIQGALAMLVANGEEPQSEIDKVTTPGGITLRGLEEMERCGFSEAVISGLKASK